MTRSVSSSHRSIAEVPMEHIRECLNYDPVSGDFIWKVRPLHHFISIDSWKQINTKYANKKAGHYNVARDQYKIGVTYDGVLYFFEGSHLAWVMSGHRLPPDMELDHKDRDHSNNALDNLRPATPSQNSCNRVSRRCRETGLHPGVRKDAGCKRWGASITVRRVVYNLGRYDTYEEALKVRLEAEREHFGEFVADIPVPFALNDEDERWINSIGNL